MACLAGEFILYGTEDITTPVSVGVLVGVRFLCGMGGGWPGEDDEGEFDPIGEPEQELTWNTMLHVHVNGRDCGALVQFGCYQHMTRVNVKAPSTLG